ncbi:MAG: hypothetical protein L0Y58_21235 [Verrucomicrobia subdivision 3 bacterium]|nr:hypothetical protein [Limisphaerales bacterium]
MTAVETGKLLSEFRCLEAQSETHPGSDEWARRGMILCTPTLWPNAGEADPLNL